MDAKDRMGFINKMGAAGESTVPPRVCVKCGAMVKGKYCSKCGTPAGNIVVPTDGPDPEQNLNSAPDRTEALAPDAEKRQEASVPIGREEYEKEKVRFEEAPGVIRPRTSGGVDRRPVKKPVPHRSNSAVPAANPRAAEGGNTERRLSEKNDFPAAERRRVKPYVMPARRPVPSRERETGIFRAVQIEEDAGQSVFAQGLPEWNIEPPQTPVKRKSAKTIQK